MLKIRFKDNKYNAVWLVEPKISVGRSATNALVIDDPLVGDVHFEVLVDNETLTLKNLISIQPVKVNGLDVSGACALKADDQITIGSVELIVIDPKKEAKVIADDAASSTQLRAPKVTGWSLKANHTALANRVFPVQELTVIGRASECDISLAASHMSRRHAQLQVVDGLLFVKDLGSANGTFLNGKKVAEARVKRGDELRFDALSFGVIGPADDLAKTTVRKAVEKPNVVEHKPLSTKAISPHSLVTATTKSSSVSRSKGDAIKYKNSQDTSGSGKFGLIFIAVIALVVIVTLIVTRQ